MNKNTLIVLIVIIVLALGFFVLNSKKTLSPVNNTSTTTAPTSEQTNTYTATEVTQHKDASSCWSTINGKVYDLTNWINSHPGGPDKILSICGSDGTSAFNGQHTGQAEPKEKLDGFFIGNLSP